MFDANEETCWNSDQVKPWIVIVKNNYVLAFYNKYHG